ncbi:MAG: hypothetical protein LUF04_10325 [Bacteroides sp.]|nr:hypothetical protein [Bacteroides sp.]
MEDNKKIDQKLIEWARIVCETYKEKIQELKPQTQLYDSASYGIKEDGGEKIAYLLLRDYWKYIESGRKAGSFPPVSAMEEWIKKRNIVPQPFTLPNGKQKIPTNNQLAFLIGRKIAKEGIKMHPFLYETINEHQSALLTSLLEALTEQVIEEINKELNT